MRELEQQVENIRSQNDFLNFLRKLIAHLYGSGRREWSNTDLHQYLLAIGTAVPHVADVTGQEAEFDWKAIGMVFLTAATITPEF